MIKIYPDTILFVYTIYIFKIKYMYFYSNIKIYKNLKEVIAEI